jgi:rhodanese-related sulfurtransferase
MHISPADLHSAIQSRTAPLIVDVRTRSEYRNGHIAGAIHFPFWTIASRTAEIPGPPDRPIVVYCLRGPRAWVAGSVLRRHGFRNVIYVQGHMHAWRKAGLPEETKPR